MRSEPVMSNCTSGCPTPGAHRTWGECMRAKSIRMGYIESGMDATRERQWQSELSFARGAMEQGILPDNTTRKAVEHAYEMSEKTGIAYRGDTRPDLAEANKYLGIE